MDDMEFETAPELEDDADVQLTIRKEENPKVPHQFKIKMNARKDLAGNILIFDHPDIDILILPDKNKIVTFPKDFLTDEIYDTQRRFFDFLKKKGIVIYDSVQGGNVCGSIEGNYSPESKWAEPTQMTLFTINKFFEEELPKQEFVDSYLQGNKDDITDPSAEDTTELGQVPHSGEKGALRTNYNAYGNMVPYRTW